MEMRQNTFKAALADGRQQIGFWCSIGDSLVVEMLAGCGYDWLLIDCEHTTLDPAGVLPALQAVAPYPTHPIVRPSSLDVAEIKKLLDLGAQTLLVPYIQTVEEARLAVAAVDYPPTGIRGVAGTTRASGFGAIPRYHARARDEICLLLQIETVEALEVLDEVAALDGVDGIFIGPSDLAASMGHPGNPGHPDVHEACADAIRRVRAAGKPAGFLSPDQAFVAKMIDAGSLFTAVGIDLVTLRQEALMRRETWR